MSGVSFMPFLGGGAGIGFPVSLGTNGAALSTSTNILTTGATVPAGGIIFVTSCFVKATTIAITSIADSNGNTYAAAVTAGWSATGLDNQEIWFASSPSSLASGSTITITLNGLSSNAWPMCAAFATGLTATPLDTHTSTKYESGTGTIASGSTGVLANARELIIGATGFYTAATLTEDAAFTQINDLDVTGTGNHVRSHLAYKIVNATTAVNYQPSVNTSIFGGTMIATFKGA